MRPRSFLPALAVVVAACSSVIGIQDLKDVKDGDGGSPDGAAPEAEVPPVTTPEGGAPDVEAGCAPSRFDLDGFWKGSFTQPEAPGLSLTGEGELEQTCNAITGEIKLGGSLPFGSCVKGGAVNGTISEDGAVTGTLFDGVTTVNLTALATSSNQLAQGRFTVKKSTACAEQSGDFSVTKQ